VSPEDVTTVAQQILAAWENIQQGNFHTGCGKDDCHWCRFVKTNQLDMAAGPEEEEDHASL
jgi:DNA helicase-2/ATP-dependent DNA helicase PcrA